MSENIGEKVLKSVDDITSLHFRYFRVFTAAQIAAKTVIKSLKSADASLQEHIPEIVDTYKGAIRKNDEQVADRFERNLETIAQPIGKSGLSSPPCGFPNPLV